MAPRECRGTILTFSSLYDCVMRSSLAKRAMPKTGERAPQNTKQTSPSDF